MVAWCQQNGVSYSEIKDSNHGSRSVDTVAVVAPHLDAKKAAEEIEAGERAGLEDLKEIEGARDFLSRLPQGRWGIATSSHPEHCLVFEDSETGARSALNAGCSVLVVGNSPVTDHPRIVGRGANFSEFQLLVDEDGRLEIVVDSTLV
jgi:sugar-phosphatase